MDTPISKSQTRAMRLLGLALTDSYQAAAEKLDAAGYRKDGIPSGLTWRTAGKLADAELTAKLNADREADRIARSECPVIEW